MILSSEFYYTAECLAKIRSDGTTKLIFFLNKI